MKNADGTMVEADVVINDVTLDFAQSMTLRVAVSTFLMCTGSAELGEIGPLYAERCREILAVIHNDIKQQRTVPKLTDDEIGTWKEIERLEAALRWIGINSEDPESVRDLVSRALRGKSLP